VIKLGKTAPNMALLDATLRSPHNLAIRVRLLDLDHNYKKDLTPYFVEGQVSVDADAEVTRALDMTFLDPEGKVPLDPDEPGSTSVFIADMISVVYVVQDSIRQNTWEIPVFCGPVDDVSRDDIFLDVKCLGKESLALTNLWQGRNFKKGQEKTWVIKQILTDLCGETKLTIPNRDAKLPNDMKLNREDIPWKVAKNIAGSLNQQLFYDGRGVATMRPRKTSPVLTLDGTWRTSEPQFSYDLSVVVNAVDVIGGKPKKAKHKVKARAVAPRSHPLSPWRLGRGGAPRYLWVEIQDDSLRTTKECKELANKVLKQGLLAGLTMACDGIPHPRLQELDVMRVVTAENTVTLNLRKFTIPLNAGEDASYGYLRRAKPKGGAKGVVRKKRKGGGKHNNKGKNTNKGNRHHKAGGK
jgi:hypothetical protein